ncbi:MAG: hypothetical protein PVI50_00865 [Gammaproteobacteria bacterium]|jgi:hypothetical protein
MAAPEDLQLDDDGVPVLTDIIEPEADSANAGLSEGPPAAIPVNDTLRAALDSAAVRQQLDEIAGELTSHFREEIEELLRPAIEQVVTEVMDDSRTATYDVIRGELGARLPAVLTRALQDATDEES